MKKLIIILIFAMLILAHTVSPVSAADPVTDILDGVNSLINSIGTISNYIWDMLVAIGNIGLYVWQQAKIPVLTLLYPFILIINLLYTDMGVIYTPFASVVNFLLSVPEFALQTIQNFAPVSDSPYTSDAIESLVGSYIYTMWVNHRHIESTAYALLSVAMMVFSISAMIFLRIVRILLWIYRQIPIVGGH